MKSSEKFNFVYQHIYASAYEGTNEESGKQGRIQLLLESEDKSLFNFGDNLVVTPFGDLIVCEDQYTDVVGNHLRGVTPAGELYNFARLHAQTELSALAFRPTVAQCLLTFTLPLKRLLLKVLGINSSICSDDFQLN